MKIEDIKQGMKVKAIQKTKCPQSWEIFKRDFPDQTFNATFDIEKEAFYVYARLPGIAYSFHPEDLIPVDTEMRTCIGCVDAIDGEHGPTGHGKCSICHIWGSGDARKYYRKGEKTMRTKEQTIKLHREMWDRLAKNPALNKKEVVEGMGYVASAIMNYCFCCDYARAKNGEGFIEMCRDCPLEWPDKDARTDIPTCEGARDGRNFLYSRWLGTDKISEKIALAEQIRDLPEKEDKKGFDGLKIEETLIAFDIVATKNGETIEAPYIASIMKDGSGIMFYRGVNRDVFKRFGDQIQLLN